MSEGRRGGTKIKMLINKLISPCMANDSSGLAVQWNWSKQEQTVKSRFLFIYFVPVSAAELNVGHSGGQVNEIHSVKGALLTICCLLPQTENTPHNINFFAFSTHVQSFIYIEDISVKTKGASFLEHGVTFNDLYNNKHAALCMEDNYLCCTETYRIQK